jgi:DNA-binding response OmpR family regulator
MKPKLKILLIDDDKDFGLILTYFFADKPYLFFVAHTLKEGIAMMEKERPDHIFLDNGLPDGFGWEKADFILNTYPLVQLNLLSALIVPVHSTHIFRILQKPISTDRFMSCLAVA